MVVLETIQTKGCEKEGLYPTHCCNGKIDELMTSLPIWGQFMVAVAPFRFTKIIWQRHNDPMYPISC